MDFAEQLKGAVDIVAVVGEHVRLRKSGAYRYMGLCPFHNEKTPSFTVHATHQFYKCFACGAGGDVFKFVMEIEGISFYEALKLWPSGTAFPCRSARSTPTTIPACAGALFELHELAQEQFRANLRGPAGEAARAYLARRGVAPETIERVRAGLCRPLRAGRCCACFEQRGFSRGADGAVGAGAASARTAASTTVSATA